MVSFITLLSYCSQIQRREAMSGAARMVFSDASTGRVLSYVTSPATAASLGKGPLIDRRLIRQRRDRHVRNDFAIVLHHKTAVSVVMPMTAKSSSHFLKMASACASRPGFSTASMRSWLSDSIMS